MAKKEKKNQIDISPIVYLWEDRKRRFGLPLSFTKYKISADRLFFEKGLLNIKEEEVQLYRVADISLKMNLWQRIFKVGSVVVASSDYSTQTLILKNVKNPRNVKELLNQQVEKVKIARNYRIGELVDAHGNPINDVDHDGIPDEIDPHIYILA